MSLSSDLSSTIKIIQIFGVLKGNLQIFCNQNQILQTSFENNSNFETDPITVQPKSNIQIKIQNSELIPFSVQINLSVLPKKGKVWLPLSSKPDSDLLSNPEFIDSNVRIMIEVRKPNAFKLIYLSKMKEFKNYKEKIDSYIENLNQLYLKTNQEKTEAEDQFLELQNKHEEFIKKSSDREMSMLLLIEKKDRELQELTKKLCKKCQKSANPLSQSTSLSTNIFENPENMQNPKEPYKPYQGPNLNPSAQNKENLIQ